MYTLSSSYSRSDLPFLVKVRLSPTLTLSPLMIWCFGLTALFRFLLAKAAPAYLPIALSVASRPLFPFQQTQYALASLLKPAPLCKLFAGLGNTIKSAISLLLLSNSCPSFITLSSPPSFILSQFLWQELSSLSSCSIRLHWVPGHSFFWGNDVADELARRGALLAPLQSLVVSLLLFVSTLVFSRTGDVLSHRNSSTHRFPRFPLRNLCFYVMLAVFSFVFDATDTVFCQVLSFQDWQIREFFLQRLRTLVPGHLSSHSALSSYGLFGDSLSLFDLWSRPCVVSPLLGLHGLPPCPHPSEGVG